METTVAPPAGASRSKDGHELTTSPKKVSETSRKPKPHSSKVIRKFVALVAALLLWHLIAVSPFVAPNSVPTPIDVIQAFFSLWMDNSYWIALSTTLITWVSGLAVCVAIGVPVGLLIGVSLRATQSTRWIVDFFRTIPTVALLPLLLLLFGPTMEMGLSMIVLSALWPILIQSMYAAKQVEPLLKWVFRVFRVSPVDKIRFLWAPSVALFVSTGVRLGAIIALLVTITAEYVGGVPGLGRQLSVMEQTLQRPEVFAYAATAGLIGVLLNFVLLSIQRRFLWWHPSIRGEKAE